MLSSVKTRCSLDVRPFAAQSSAPSCLSCHSSTPWFIAEITTRRSSPAVFHGVRSRKRSSCHAQFQLAPNRLSHVVQSRTFLSCASHLLRSESLPQSFVRSCSCAVRPQASHGIHRMDDIELVSSVPMRASPSSPLILSSQAYNGRQVLIGKLMTYVQIDALGTCLNNAPRPSSALRSHPRENAAIYAAYKFVIAIENSNCEDYVTEKFIDALSSTAIPIVAGRLNKPDYARFAPRHSYINVYDYPSVKHLADHLIYLANNETAYNEYHWYRRGPNNSKTVNSCRIRQARRSPRCRSSPPRGSNARYTRTFDSPIRFSV